MKNAVKALWIASYILSIVYLPWWWSVALAIVLIAVFEAYITAALGALVMDVTFGTAIVALGGFSYLYAAIIITAGALAFVIRRAMLE